MTSVQLVPIDRIRVLNPRSRNKARFLEVVASISRVGLKKPITVSRNEGGDGYDLVCGQGRLEAYVACGATEIPALVVNIPLEDRLLLSLVENLTRRAPSGGELVRDIIGLKDRGRSATEIAALIGVSESYASQLLNLIETGEERLVAAVERGDIPITVAIKIAGSDDARMQRSLQEAYESGQLRGRGLLKVRRIIEERRVRGKEIRRGRSCKRKVPSSHDLIRTLRRETQRQELLVKRSRQCEQQLRFVSSALRDLLKDERFTTLLKAEKLDMIPKHVSELIHR